MSSAARRRSLASVCLVLVAAGGLAGCGLPDEGRTQVVEDASVPYDLLEQADSPAGSGDDEHTLPRQVPVVFWLTSEDRLVPAAADLSCEQDAGDVVRGVLDVLAASPSASERGLGLSSAIPPTARLELVGVDAGVAEVELDPLAIGDAERLPLAVGQVVLSVTSAPGVDEVRLVTSGRAVDLPLPDGALATGTATAGDYAELLPDRLASEVAGSGEIGCPAPAT